MPNLVKALEEESLRPKIAAILGRLGPDAKEAAPALAEIVEKDKSPAARREALIALGSIGPFAAEQAPTIAKVLQGRGFPASRGGLLLAGQDRSAGDFRQGRFVGMP